MRLPPAHIWNEKQFPQLCDFKTPPLALNVKINSAEFPRPQRNNSPHVALALALRPAAAPRPKPQPRFSPGTARANWMPEPAARRPLALLSAFFEHVFTSARSPWWRFSRLGSGSRQARCRPDVRMSNLVRMECCEAVPTQRSCGLRRVRVAFARGSPPLSPAARSGTGLAAARTGRMTRREDGFPRRPLSGSPRARFRNSGRIAAQI